MIKLFYLIPRWTLTSTSIPGQSETESNSNKRSSTFPKLLDGSLTGHSLVGGSFHSAEIQSVDPTLPADIVAHSRALTRTVLNHLLISISTYIFFKFLGTTPRIQIKLVSLSIQYSREGQDFFLSFFISFISRSTRTANPQVIIIDN